MEPVGQISLKLEHVPSDVKKPSSSRNVFSILRNLFLLLIACGIICLLVLVIFMVTRNNKDTQLLAELSELNEQLNNLKLSLPTAAPQPVDNNAIELAQLKQQLANRAWFADQIKQFKDSLTATQQQLQIGVLLPLTGHMAYMGGAIKGAIELAIAEANVNSDEKISLQIRDTNSDPMVALACVQELSAAGVNTFLGPITSSEALFLANSTRDQDVLFISPTATADQLRDFPQVISLSPENSRLVDAMLRQMSRLKMAQALVFYRNNTYGQSMANALTIRNQYQEQPLNLYFVSYEPTTTIAGNDTFVNQVKQTMQQMSSTPYTSVIAVAQEEIVDLLRLSHNIPSLQTMGWFVSDSVALGTDNIDDADAQAVAQSVLLTGFSYAGDSFNAYNRIREVDQLHSALGDTPSFQSVLAYDAANLLLQAVRQYGQPSARLLGTQIRQSTAFTGLTGPLTFDEAGFRRQGAYAVMTFTPITYPRLVQLPTDGHWILQSFYTFGGSDGSLLNLIAGGDLLNKTDLMLVAQQRNIDCSSAKMQVSLRDTISHVFLQRVYDLSTMPEILVLQAAFGWQAQAVCTGVNGTYVLEVGCSGFDSQGQRNCFVSTPGTDGRPGRRLLQTTSTTVCAIISPICSVLKSVASTINFGGNSNANTISQIVIGGICDANTLGCKIASQLNTAGLMSSVVCTELYRQDKMPMHLFLADHRFGSDIASHDPNVYIGYRLVADPVVKAMQQSEAFSDVVAQIAVPWAQHMAYLTGDVEQGHWVGRLLLYYGVPACRAVGFVYTNLRTILTTVVVLAVAVAAGASLFRTKVTDN